MRLLTRLSRRHQARQSALCKAAGRRKKLFAALTASLLAVSAGVTTASSAPAATAVPVAGSVPSWATATNRVGAEPATDHIGFRVYLTERNSAQLAAFDAAVSNPRSRLYRQFLTDAQFNADYAPTHTDVAAVHQWLSDAGFTVDFTPSNNLYVLAEGSVATVESAFGVAMNLYRVKGVTLHGPASDPMIPSKLAGTVSAVVGLDESSYFVHTDIAKDPGAPPPPVLTPPGPCSTYWGQTTTADGGAINGPVSNPYSPGTPIPWVPCGYTPQQLQSAYGVSTLLADGVNGHGVTVAITDGYASPTIFQDLTTYSSRHGLAAPINGVTFKQMVAPGTYNHPEAGIAQDPQGWAQEETLDVEAVHAMAPGATILYVGAPNSYQDLDAAVNDIVANHLASIITNSWGFNTEQLAPGYILSFHSITAEAVATGIGVYFASSDCGDESALTCSGAAGHVTPDYPASDPNVTAVGGTSVAIGAGGTIESQVGWGTGVSAWTGSAWSPTPPGSFFYGSGGGVSSIFAEPSYQQTARGPGSLAGGHRTIPDVAFDGDPNTGFLAGQTQTFPDGTVAYSEYRIGGTSLSSPAFAGIMALRDQAGGAHGFSNPSFYTAPAGDFTDVLPGLLYLARNTSSVTTLRTSDQDTSLTTRKGYDLDTGLGTPVAGLLASLP